MRLFLLAILLWGFTLPMTGYAKPIALHLEAEQGVLTGCTVLTKQTGFSGTGYVGDFAPKNARIVWTIPHARAGVYTVTLRALTPFGPKGYELVINGARSSGRLPASQGQFITQSAGKVELREGENTVQIDRGWGYYEIDALDLVPSAAPAPLAVPSGRLSDPQATPKTQSLMHALLRTYGKKTFSGQYGLSDCDYIRTTTDKTPAILGTDLMDYSPSRLAHGTKPEGLTERAIAAERAGQIVTLVWHWNAPTALKDTPEQPWFRGFYTEATTFDLAQAINHPDSEEYKLLLRDIDAIAVQLQRYADADIPVLWRPLHEAEGGWFWWGAHGPTPFKQLWRLLYDRLTNTHHLHNLIWVYSSGTNPQWYPGDDCVDVIGIDEYPADTSDSCIQDWETLLKQYGGRKPLALTEFGGVPDIAKMQRFGVRWSYFVSWNGRPQRMPPSDVRQRYQFPAVITQNDKIHL